jgi:hypothetical protein
MFRNMPLGLCCAIGPPRGGRMRVRWTTASVVVGIGICAIGAAHADPGIVLPNGLPVQVHPTFPEPTGFFVSGRRRVVCGRVEFER